MNIAENMLRAKADFDAVYNAGLEAGKANGGGYDEGYAAGRQDHNKMLWESMSNENLWMHTFAGHYWNDTTFNPVIDLVVPYATQTFYRSRITDLKGILQRNGVKLDYSTATRLNAIYEQSTITRSPEIDTRKCVALQNFLYNASELVSVDKIILKDDGSQSWSALGFDLLKKLEEVTFEGVIGCDMNISSAKNLTHDSLMSIINALKDFRTYEEVITEYPDYYLGNGTPDEFWTHDTWCEIDRNQTTDAKIYFYFEKLGGSSHLYIIDSKNGELISNVKEFIGDATHICINSGTGGSFSLKSLKATVTATKTLTLGTTNLAKLTEEEKKIATDKGWTLA